MEFFQGQFPIFSSIKVEVSEKDETGTIFGVVKREDGSAMTDMLRAFGHASIRMDIQRPAAAPIATVTPSATTATVTTAPPPPPYQDLVMADSVSKFPMEKLAGKEVFPVIVPHLTDWEHSFVQPFTDQSQLHMIKVNDKLKVCLYLCHSSFPFYSFSLPSKDCLHCLHFFSRKYWRYRPEKYIYLFHFL